MKDRQYHHTPRQESRKVRKEREEPDNGIAYLAVLTGCASESRKVVCMLTWYIKSQTIGRL